MKEIKLLAVLLFTLIATGLFAQTYTVGGRGKENTAIIVTFLATLRNERYWSSSQDSRREAWAQSFNKDNISMVFFTITAGDQTVNMKLDNYLVRPIRAF